jgi:hypothetical protein
MTGLSNYTADAALNWITGSVAFPSLPSVYLALFTVVGTDAGTGFTEVSTSGTAYARLQVAGSAATNSGTLTSSATLHFSSTPSWIVAGMYIYDTSTSGAITLGTTVLSTTGTTVVMSANATGAGVGSSDTIVFSAFASATGTAPSTVTNNAALTYATATASWGTVVAFGLYDASTSGDLLLWDFIGNYSWLPFTVTSVGSGNGGVFDSHAHGITAGSPVVVTAEYGGTLPTVTQESLTSYAINFAANITTDTLTLSTSSSAPSSANAVWTSSTGDGFMRQIVQQQIPSGITVSYSASALTTSIS